MSRALSAFLLGALVLVAGLVLAALPMLTRADSPAGALLTGLALGLFGLLLMADVARPDRGHGRLI